MGTQCRGGWRGDRPEHPAAHHPLRRGTLACRVHRRVGRGHHRPVRQRLTLSQHGTRGCADGRHEGRGRGVRGRAEPRIICGRALPAASRGSAAQRQHTRPLRHRRKFLRSGRQPRHGEVPLRTPGSADQLAVRGTEGAGGGSPQLCGRNDREPCGGGRLGRRALQPLRLDRGSGVHRLGPRVGLCLALMVRRRGRDRGRGRRLSGRDRDQRIPDNRKP